MNNHHHLPRILIVGRLLVAIMILTSCGLPGAFALDDKGHRRGGGGGKHHGGGNKYHGGKYHGGGGGHNFFGISPQGITYGYHDKNFGIQIGPLFGGGYGYDDGYGYGHSHLQTVPEYYVPQRAPYVEPPLYALPANPPVYNQPAPVRELPPVTSGAAKQPTTNLIPTSERASPFQRDAEQAFREHRYGEALRLTRHAAVEDSQNGLIFLFGSQAAFAVGDYQSAANALGVATSQLDSDQWGYVVKNFRRIYNNDDYVKQMDRLVDFTAENPDVSYPRTLRGFHYAYLGYPDAANKQLAQALEIDPGDDLARRLLTELSAEEIGEELPIPAPQPRNGENAESELAGPK